MQEMQPSSSGYFVPYNAVYSALALSSSDGFCYVVYSNYFTGYCVLGGACMICPFILFAAAAMLLSKA